MDDLRALTSPQIVIAGRRIGADFPPYLIAEISGNHNGRLTAALDLIDAAKEAGADAVKMQTYTADTLTIDYDGPGFRISGGLWDGRTLYDLYQEAGTPLEWHQPMFERAAKLGIPLFSSPFDAAGVEFLEKLNAPAYKIASFEAMDLPLVNCAATTGKPLIISTGTVSPPELAEVVESVRHVGDGALALLHCVSAYPAKAADSNLRTIAHLADKYGVVAGLSDHTTGTAVAVAGVALGAAIVEKHFTLRRSDGGPDAAFSVEPAELAQLTRDCRMAWEAMGSVREGRQMAANENLVFRRSLYVVRDMTAGEVFSHENLRSIRPGYGLPPKYFSEILGYRAKIDIKRGAPLSWGLIEK